MVRNKQKGVDLSRAIEELAIIECQEPQSWRARHSYEMYIEDLVSCFAGLEAVLVGPRAFHAYTY